MTQRPDAPAPRLRIVQAVLRLAMGDATAIAAFGGTTAAFVQSLIPLLALPLVVGLATILSGQVVRGVTDLLAALCALLVPAWVSHVFARAQGREAAWLRFVVAFNWCQFGLSLVGLVMLLLLGAMGPPSHAAGLVLVIGCLAVMAYGLWLPWFVARHGLGVSGPKAALLVAVIYLCTLSVLVTRNLLSMENG